MAIDNDGNVEVASESWDVWDAPVEDVIQFLQENSKGLTDCTVRYSSNDDDAEIFVVGKRKATDEERLAHMQAQMQAELSRQEGLRRQMKQWKEQYPDVFEEVARDA